MSRTSLACIPSLVVFYLSLFFIIYYVWTLSPRYVFLLGPHNAIVAMIIVYSAECFATKTRGRGTGVVAAATKIAGIAAPYFITTILTTGLLWQLSVVVSLSFLISPLSPIS